MKTNGWRMGWGCAVLAAVVMGLSASPLRAQEEEKFDQGFNLLSEGRFMEALPLIEESAKAGNPMAQYVASLMYERGYTPNIARDPQKAYHYANLASRHNFREAINLFGNLLREGIGTKRDPERAAEEFERAALLGDLNGICNIGIAYGAGIGRERNLVEAFAWLLIGTKQKHQNCVNNFAVAVKQMTQEQIKQGEARSAELEKKIQETQTTAGKTIQFSWNPRNAEDAIVERGEQFYLDEAYEQAMKHLLPPAHGGNAYAQFYVARMYETGRGVEIDAQAALRWYHRSAQAGNATSMYNLGWMIRNGEGTAQDLALGGQWLKAAAYRAHLDAANEVGHYTLTEQGFERDAAEAYAWFSLAAAQGHEQAKQNLEILLKNGIDEAGIEAGKKRIAEIEQAYREKKFPPLPSMPGAEEVTDEVDEAAPAPTPAPGPAPPLPKAPNPFDHAAPEPANPFDAGGGAAPKNPFDRDGGTGAAPAPAPADVAVDHAVADDGAPVAPASPETARAGEAPKWVKPGARITFYGMTGMVSDVGEVYVEDPNGPIPDLDNPQRRYRIDKTAPSAGGHGFTQVDVVGMDGKNVLLETRAYVMENVNSPPTLTGVFGTVADPATGSGIWQHPDALARMPNQTGPFKVTRGKWKIGTEVYDAVLMYINNEHGGGVYQIYDERCGLRLHLTIQNKYIGGMTLTGGGYLTKAFVQGGAQIKYQDFRHVDLPWAEGRMPDWVARTKQLTYRGGTRTNLNPKVFIPLTMTFDIEEVGDGWVKYKKTVTQGGGDLGPSIPEAEERVCGVSTFGGMWVDPRLIADVQPNQKLDEDRLIGYTQSVSGFGQTADGRRTVVLTESARTYRVDYSYDVQSGMLVGLRVTHPQLNMQQEVQLAGVR